MSEYDKALRMQGTVIDGDVAESLDDALNDDLSNFMQA